MTAREIYDGSIKQLPEPERIRLAAMILNDIANTAAPVDYSDEWTEEDMRDFSNASWQHIDQALGDEENHH